MIGKLTQDINQATMDHPDDREIFASTFDRQNLIKLRAEGQQEVHLVTRQIGDDDIYRKAETTDYFVRSASSDDILVITRCDKLPG